MMFSVIANARHKILGVISEIVAPPPPIDLNKWAEEKVSFGSESPFPGPYNSDRFPYFRRILEVLSPEHPARIVVLKKSAQLGGTVVAQIFLGGCLDLDPSPFFYVHPSEGNATKWVKTKWKPMVRAVKALAKIFPQKSRDGSSSTLFQERFDGRGHIQLAGANSEAGLSMMSFPRQVQDDLSKWELNNAGDPEDQADSRSKAFDWAKIFKNSTPLLEDNCKISKNFEQSTQEHWHVPCPHCMHKQPLEWENMLQNLDEDHPEDACFYCTACGGIIEHKHKQWMNERGEWVAHNPGTSIVGFYLWAAYSPLETWQRIAETWIKAKGDPAKEQVFLNDTVGKAYKQAGEAPPWEGLRDRAEESCYVRGKIPAGGLILTYGVDCQVDRVEWHLKAFGRNLRRWTVDYGIIAGHISDDDCRKELNALLKKKWRDEFGNHREADMLAIDAGYSKTDVMDWAKTHPQSKVIAVRGAKSDNAPEMALVKAEKTSSGKTVRYQKRFWNVGVSSLKGSLYSNLKKDDPIERGYCAYPQGMDDEFYRQICAERRAPIKTRSGYVEWRWIKNSSQANEALDTEIYAEAAAIRLGWRRMDEEAFDKMQTEREKPCSDVQEDLFNPDLSAKFNKKTDEDKSDLKKVVSKMA